MWPPILLLPAAAALAVAGSAHAHDAGPTVGRAVEALRSAPVWVDPEASVSELSGDALGRSVQRGGHLYMAVLPASAEMEAGGDPDFVAGELHEALGADATYVAVIGGRIGIYTTDIESARAQKLAANAESELETRDLAGVLIDLAARIEREPRTADGDASRALLTGAVAAGVLVALTAVVLLRRQGRGAGTPPEARP